MTRNPFSRSINTDAFLGRASVAIARPGHAATWQPVPAGADPIAALFQQAAQSQPRPTTLAIWLSGAHARPFVAGPLTGVRRWQEAQTVLAAMAPDATGLPGPCTVWIAGPIHREASLVVAVPTALLDELHGQANAHALRLRSVRPWWSAAFNAALMQAAQAHLMVLDDGEALTSLQGLAGQTTHAATQWPAPDAGQRSGWLARLMAGRNLTLQHTASVCLGAEQPPPWQPLAGVPFGAALQAAQAPAEGAAA